MTKKAKNEKLDFKEIERALLQEYGEEVISRGINKGVPEIIPTGIFMATDTARISTS